MLGPDVRADLFINVVVVHGSQVGSDGMVQFFAEKALEIIKASESSSGSLRMEGCSCTAATCCDCASTGQAGLNPNRFETLPGSVDFLLVVAKDDIYVRSVL
jgi:hypothetical protein